MYKSLLGDTCRNHTHHRIMFSLANSPVKGSYSLLKNNVILKASQGLDRLLLIGENMRSRGSRKSEDTHPLYNFFTTKTAPFSQMVQFFLLTNVPDINSSILKSHNPGSGAHHDRIKAWQPCLGGTMGIFSPPHRTPELHIPMPSQSRHC